MQPGSKEWWLEQDGKTVIVDGKRWKIHARQHRAKYPRDEIVITVHAEMTNKNDPEYLESKRQLRDDWQLDVLKSEGDFPAKAIKYLIRGQDRGNKMFPIKWFRFSIPGGISGKVKAATANAAAELVLGSKAYYLRGDSLAQPWEFIANNREIRIYEVKPKSL